MSLSLSHTPRRTITWPKMVFNALHIRIIKLLLILVISYSIDAQTITNTTLHVGQVACANTDVTFTCQTIGSSAIAWRSERFIGAGNTAHQLIFSADRDDVNSTLSINSTTVANLTKNQLMNGMQLLETTLRVVVPANSTTTLSVTCVYLDNNRNSTINFTIRPLPMEVQRATVVRVPCVNSTSCLAVVSWYPPSNSKSADVTQYNIRVTASGAEVANTTRTCGIDDLCSNETALSAYYVVANCTEEYLQNVAVSGVAVNECGEGPKQDALLLLNPADNIGDLEVSCPANFSHTGPTSPSVSAATESSIGILYGALVLNLAFMKTDF